MGKVEVALMQKKRLEYNLGEIPDFDRTWGKGGGTRSMDLEEKHGRLVSS